MRENALFTLNPLQVKVRSTYMAWMATWLCCGSSVGRLVSACVQAPLSKMAMADTAEFTLDVLMDLNKSLEQSDNNKAVIKKLTKLSATIGEAWPEAYTKILHKNRLDEGDIFFIPNVEDPSSIELRAAAIIANNQLLEVFSNKVS